MPVAPPLRGEEEEEEWAPTAREAAESLHHSSSLNDAPPDLVHRVLRDGLLVLELDRAARIAFEVRARNEYFDLLPFLRRYRGMEGA